MLLLHYFGLTIADSGLHGALVGDRDGDLKKLSSTLRFLLGDEGGVPLGARMDDFGGEGGGVVGGASTKS